MFNSGSYTEVFTGSPAIFLRLYTFDKKLISKAKDLTNFSIELP